MLTYLSVENLAIFDTVELELQDGLTVISGETGSGKSVLLSAIGLLTGAPLLKDRLRQDAEELNIQGIFSTQEVPENSVREALNLDPQELIPEELTIRRSARVLDKGKRERIFVDGRLAQLRDIQALGELFISISGQHESVGLLKRQEHLRLLDTFAQTSELLEVVGALHGQFVASRKKLADLQERSRVATQRLEELDHLLEGLERLELQRGEEDELKSGLERMAHSADIAQVVSAGLSALYEEDLAVVPQLSKLIQHFQTVERHEPRLSGASRSLTSLVAELEEVVSTLRGMQGGEDFDPDQMDRIQERLASIEKLKRRHGVSHSDELLDLQERLSLEREELTGVDVHLEKLKNQMSAAEEKLRRQADQLSVRRKRAAVELQKAIHVHLKELDMGKARFEVEFAGQEEPGPTGIDRVQFLLAPNPGSSPMPLASVASGGELSRVLLALKAVVSDAYGVPTYVLDEVDSGIGGRTALSVALLLSRLARTHQVLCITHTPQLAAFADHHLVISKESTQGSTRGRLSWLKTEDQRVEELARMMSGLVDSQTARDHARELLGEAEMRKEKG